MTDEFAAKQPDEQANGNVERVSDDLFSAEVGALIDRAEETRLTKSKQYTTRRRIHNSVSTTLLGVTLLWLAWTLLMGGNLGLPLLLLAAASVIPIFLNIWSNQPKVSYIKQFKYAFMPQLAKSMAKLHFHATGGISMKALKPSRIVPPCDDYEAEDCFRGKYKGVNLMISEARMYSKREKNGPVFDGVLVFLSIKEKKFKGHTIITADHAAVKRYKNNRWKQFQPVTVSPGVNAGRFMVFGTDTAEAQGLADHDFMELLNKLYTLFDNAAISAAFYAGKRVLLLIPNDDDMFEPGDIYMPFTSKSHAMKCKREVEQILNIADVLNVYEADSSPQSRQAAQPADTAPQQPPAYSTADNTAPETAPPAAPAQPDQSPPPQQTPPETPQQSVPQEPPQSQTPPDVQAGTPPETPDTPAETTPQTPPAPSSEAPPAAPAEQPQAPDAPESDKKDEENQDDKDK